MSLHVVSGNTPSEVVEAWEQAVGLLLEHFGSTFAQWFSSVEFDSLTSGVLQLSARDEFVRDWVRDHFQAEVVETLEATLGSRVSVNWNVRSDLGRPVCMPPRSASGPHSSEQGRLAATTAPEPGRSTDQSGVSAGVPVERGAVERGAVDSERRANGTSQDEGSDPELRRPGRLRLPEARALQLDGGGRREPGASQPAFARGSERSGPERGGSERGGSERGGSERGGEPGARQSFVARKTRPEQLNTKFTFNNFVVGPSNELAYAAAVAAAGGGGPRYTPLFICGGTGLGKTHLMHSIAHYVLDQRRDACVLYVSAERFTNQFIEALQHHKMEEFRYRYRSECDVLLVDDIQFLAGREQTQEEFFHTFNALHEADKPIVVSSDKYPQDLQRMPERLISRFASGLVADIQTPALETRVAIVLKKAHLEGIRLADDVAVFLAQNVRSNVRELEGTLIRLAAKSSLVGRTIDLAFAQAELSLVSPVRPDVRSVEDIQRAVCGHFRLTNADLLSKDRHKSVAFARQVAMYLCRQRLKCSFPELGRAFGNRDHTTVMSAVRRVEALRAKDPQVKAHIEAIEDKLAKSDV